MNATAQPAPIEAPRPVASTTTGPDDGHRPGFLELPPPLPIEQRRLHRLVLLLIVVLGAAQGTYWVLTTVVWSPIDEVQHYAYVENLATGHGVPTVGETLISDDALRSVKDSPTMEYRSRPFQATASDPNWAATRHIYEAIHGPTYYVAMIPAYWLGRPFGTIASLYAVRLATVALVLCSVPLTWLLARRVFPDRPVVWLAAPALLVTFSSLSGGVVSNDPMAMLMATATTLLFLRALNRPDGLRDAALAGVLFGLTVVTKTTALVLVPFLALPALVWLARWRPRPAVALRLAGTFVGTAILAYLPWLAFNFHAYGAPSGAAASSKLIEGVLPGAAALSASLVWSHATVARGGVWLSPLLLDQPYQSYWEVATLVTLALGVLAAALRRRWRDAAVLLWCGSALPLAFLTMEAIVFGVFGGAGGPVGRHLITALPPTVVMIAGALTVALGARWGPVAVAWLITGALVLQVGVAQRFITSAYGALVLDGTSAPARFQDWSDTASGDARAVTVSVDCPATAIGIAAFGDDPAPATLTVGTPDGPVEATQVGEIAHLTTYRLPTPASGTLTVDIPAGDQLYSSAADRDPSMSIVGSPGDPVLAVFCPERDPQEASYLRLYPTGHPDALSRTTLRRAPWLLAGAAGAIALVLSGAAVAGTARDVRRRRGSG